MPVERIRDVDIDYERRGSGSTLIWGHGLTSSRAEEAVRPVLIDWERVRTRVDVVRYDARGHGRSGFSADLDRYRWDELALDELALADHLDIDASIVGGASMGAATALHTAVLAPDRVRALILVIPPTAWETRAAQAGNYRRMAELIDGGSLEQVLAAGRLVPPPDPFVDVDGWQDRSAARLRGFDPTELAALFRGASAADLPPQEAIVAIEAPTLILAWTGDPGHPVDTARRLHELLPHAVGHEASTTAGFETWTDRLIDFVTELPG